MKNTNKENAWNKTLRYHVQLFQSPFFSLWVYVTQVVFSSLCEDSSTYWAQMLSNRKEQFITGDLTPWPQLLEKKWDTRQTLQITRIVFLITIYISEQKHFSGVKNLEWLLKSPIFSFFPYLMSPTLWPRIKLGLSHFARAGIHRRFIMEIAIEQNPCRYRNYMSVTNILSWLNLQSLLLCPYCLCQQWGKKSCLQ